MLRNYFKIAWRNLVKSRGYSFINIGGLAVGMAVAMLIGLWIYDELSYNKSFKNYDRIAQVMVGTNFEGDRGTAFTVPLPLADVLRNDFGSDFKHIAITFYEGDHILTYGDKVITQTGKFIQPDGPEMFSLKMLKGSWAGLKDPASIMLSASAAKAIFGDEEPMGKQMKINNQMNVRVTGIYEDMAPNTEFRNVQFFAPWDLYKPTVDWMKDTETNWGNNSFFLYVELQPNANFKTVSEKISKTMYEHVDAGEKKFNEKVFLNPMSRWHLFGEWKNGVNVGGRVQFVWLFGIIGAFVLLLACINFMNLSTARSEKRAKEVGIRKAIGSMRSQLIRQFLSESLLVVLFGFVLSIGIVALSIPLFNEIADKKMLLPLGHPAFWMMSFVFMLVTSLLAGSYPALYLSSFSPVKVLKGTFKTGRLSALPRKVLVVIQFAVSIALIIGTIIVYRQVQYAKSRPVGYNREGLIMIPIKTPDFAGKFNLIRNELKNSGAVLEVAQSSSPFTALWQNTGGFKWEGQPANNIGDFGLVWITHEFGKTAGWQFVEGRDFSRQIATDSVSPKGDKNAIYSAVVNEAAVKYMNISHPLGTIIRSEDGPAIRIIGVIKDMIMYSPYQPVKQTIFVVNDYLASSWIDVRVNPGMSTRESLQKIESTFKKILPQVPFEYKFVDTDYGLKFIEEERIGKLSSVFSALAIFISCLGLFGLASFVAERRTKEIGVRKVLGASIYNVWKMLSKDFVILVIISCFIAIPIAWYYLYQWLQKYQYRTEISWWIFAVAAGGALLITLLTVSFQAIRAAMANPVKSLRTE